MQTNNSKSGVIREFLIQNPEARGVDVEKALRKKGVKVNSGMISTVRHAMRKKVVVSQAAVEAHSSNGHPVTNGVVIPQATREQRNRVTLTSLEAAKTLLREAGDEDTAIASLLTLVELRK